VYIQVFAIVTSQHRIRRNFWTAIVEQLLNEWMKEKHEMENERETTKRKRQTASKRRKNSNHNGWQITGRMPLLYDRFLYMNIWIYDIIVIERWRGENWFFFLCTIEKERMFVLVYEQYLSLHDDLFLLTKKKTTRFKSLYCIQMNEWMNEFINHTENCPCSINWKQTVQSFLSF